ncbi:unnamed protein product, partial [Staurois parvus]
RAPRGEDGFWGPLSGGAGGPGPPGVEHRSGGPPGGEAGPPGGDGPPGEQKGGTGLRALKAERRAPDPQGRRQVGSESTGTTVGTGSPGTGLSGSTAGIGCHQASGHLARQRAPHHLARQWAPSQTGMTAGTGSDIGSSDWTAGIGSPGIRSFGSTAGTVSSGKAVGSESTG